MRQPSSVRAKWISSGSRSTKYQRPARKAAYTRSARPTINHTRISSARTTRRMIGKKPAMLTEKRSVAKLALAPHEMQVHVAKADLTLMPVDAIVNPANSLGIMGGGAAGAIKRRGGDKILQEAMSCAPIAVGAAVVTTAGKLHARAVIHAPTMEEPGLKIGVENVRRATRAALIAAAV